MKRYHSSIYLSLMVASALLFPTTQVLAQVHLGLPSAVKSAVKKLKNKKNVATVSSIVLSPLTKVLTADTNSKYLGVSVDSTTFYYDIGATQFASLRAGDIMMSSQGEGLLRKIVSITTTPTEYSILTTTATLEEAFEKLDVTFRQTFSPSGISPQYLKSFKPQSVSLGQFEISKSVVLNPNITADATLIFTPALDGKIKIDGFQLKEFDFTSIFDGTLELTVTATAAETLTKAIKVAEFPLGTLMVGPVPVVPNYTINVGVEANLQASATAKILQDVSFEAGVQYLNGIWRPHTTLTNNFTFTPPAFSAEGTVKAYVTPGINVKILNVAGPHLDAESYIKGLVTPPINHLPWEIKGGVAINAGVEVEVLSWTLAQWSGELYGAEIQLSSGTLLNQVPVISVVSPDSASISAGATTTVTCSASDADGEPLTYAWFSASGTVTDSGSQINWVAPVSPSVYAVTCSVTDGWGGFVQKSTNIAVSIDSSSPTAPTGLTAVTAGNYQIDLSWNAATDNMGVTGYKIFRNGHGTPIAVTAGLTYSDTSLASATVYSYTVSACDAAGNCSGPSISVSTATSGTPSHELPDTGQTQSYTATFGEDHDYQPAASQPSYTDNGDGTTTDNRTGLMWVKDGNSVGCNIGNNLTWGSALSFCEGLSYAGYSDWRLPNVRELESIVDAGVDSPAINSALFLNTKIGPYWTSTTSLYSINNAWYVNFFNGEVRDTNKVNQLSVRCVRSGL